MISMLQALEKYYKKEGILSTAFTCGHQMECRGDCAAFTGPKSAFVSSGYENSGYREGKQLPRLLFLSLDSGSTTEDDEEVDFAPDEKRTPQEVRRQEEIVRSKLRKGRHWHRTHELAHCIFKNFDFDPDIKLEEAKRFFAHANSAKCCMNKKQRKQADSKLFKNCQEYLPGELEILSPEILVTQGDKAKKAILSFYDITWTFDKFAKVILLNQKRVFWLHTYHPSNYGCFHKQCRESQKWEKYAKMMREFLTAEPAAL